MVIENHGLGRVREAQRLAGSDQANRYQVGVHILEVLQFGPWLLP